jgi:hypothetical protein
MPDPEFLLRIASPRGDLTPTQAMLDTPLEGCPEKTPYRVYFQALQNIMLGCMPLLTELGLHEPQRIVLRAEKHGAFAHPASVEAVDAEGRRLKLVALVATAPLAIGSLEEERDRLLQLRERFGLHYLPSPYRYDTALGLGCLLAEWFDDFHEFHVTETGEFLLWDYLRGPRPLTDAQVREVFRKIALILTSYYDPSTHAQISPWRNAAGDFIVKLAPNEDEPDVRLTTVRGYGPRAAVDLAQTNPLLALLLFFLDLTLCGRFDRVDGTGAVVLLPELCVEGLVQGFCDGLHAKDLPRHGLEGFPELLLSFEPAEFVACLAPVLETLHGDEFTLAERHLHKHADMVCACAHRCADQHGKSA